MSFRKLSAGRQLLIGLVLACTCLPVLGLTDEEVFRDFRFNFINPGARALSLGGAFIAVGDDATAAQSNPAALKYIDRIQVFVEWRSTQRDTAVFEPSRSFGSKTPGSNDVFLDLVSVSNPEDRSFPSFVSIALPFQVGTKRWTLALSRQPVLYSRSGLSDGTRGTNLEFALPGFPVVVVNDPLTGPRTERYTVDVRASGYLDTELVYWNAGLQFELTRHFSLGITATYATLDMQSGVRTTFADPRSILDPINPRRDADGDGVLDPIVRMTSIDGTDSAFAYSVGLLWSPDFLFPSQISPIRLGVVYRKGARLSVSESYVEEAAPGVFTDVRAPFDNVIRVPDRYGVGLGYFLGRWTLAVDLERIKYSDLLEGFTTGINAFTSDVVPDSAVSRDPTRSIRFEVDDATILRVGAEYSLLTQGGWQHQFRAGFYSAPDNRLRMTEFDSSNPDVSTAYLDAFRGSETENHFTVGYSVALPAQRYQLQFAGDFGERGTELVVSSIIRLGRIRR